MLTSDLLLTRSRGPYIEPRYVDATDDQYLDLTQALIVAVSANLNVSEDDFKDVPGGVFFFKNRIQPKDVITQLEQVH